MLLFRSVSFPSATGNNAPRPHATGQNARGFTLIELMVVVVIMSVLAVIGLSSFRRHLDSSKSTEALAMLRSIAKAQEKYRATHQVYLNVSGGDLGNYYPTAAPDGATTYKFYGHPGEGLWRRLGPEAVANTTYGFSTVAGLPTDALPDLSANGVAATVTWPATVNDPWYVVQAIGNADGDGVYNLLVLTSFRETIHEENPGE